MNQPVVRHSFATHVALVAAVLSGLALGSQIPAWAQQVAAVKHDIVARAGTCVGPMSQAEALMELGRTNMRFPGAKPEEIVALGQTVRQLNGLAGGSFDLIQNKTVRFNDSAHNPRTGRTVTYSFQVDSNTVQMCRGRHPHVGLVGYLAHELGHIVGNSRNGQWYSEYKTRVRPSRPCHVSNYSRASYSAATARNEEFAEAFAAFVANPSLLEKQGGGCLDALNYFRQKFPRGMMGACQPQTQQPTILANSQDTPAPVITPPPPSHSIPDPVRSAAASTTAPNLSPSPWSGLISGIAPMLLQMLMAKPAVPVATPVPFVPQMMQAPPAGSTIPGTR